jgi:hypothetical protein
MREPTEQEKLEFVARVVDTAIVQASESSGLRDWLIKRALASYTGWMQPNAAEDLLQMHDDLIAAFEGIVDPNDEDIPRRSVSTLEYQEPSQPWLD